MSTCRGTACRTLPPEGETGDLRFWGVDRAPYPAARGRDAKEGYGKPYPYSLRSMSMATVVVSTYKVASYLEGGGHFWVYMQYVQGLQRLGCDVYWLEKLRSTGNWGQDAARVTEFLRRMDRFGLQGKCVLYYDRLKDANDGASCSYIGITSS